LAKYNKNDEVKEDEIGRGYSTHGGRRRMDIYYWWESQKEKYLKEDEGVGGWIILIWIL
jgi:hypothetical protein